MRCFMIGVGLFLCLLVIGTPVIAHAEKDPFSERTIKVDKEFLAKEEPTLENDVHIPLVESDLTLNGLFAGAEVFYEIPVQGVKKGSTLKLDVQYSDVLEKDSSFTVEIDGNPVHSSKINIKKSHMTVEIAIPKKMATAGFHDVVISFYGQLSKEMCANENDPANWFTITANSQLVIEPNDVIKRENTLEDYPYPFIQSEQRKSIQGTIVIPDDVSDTLLLSVMQVANQLNNSVPGDAVIPIVQESELEEVTTNLIVVGARDEWNGIVEKLLDEADSDMGAADELFVSNFFLQLKGSVKQMLVLTADTNQTIVERIAAVSEADLINQLAGDEMMIHDVPKEEETAIHEIFTFEDADIPSQTLTGKKSKSEAYFMPLPVYMDVYQDTVLHAHIRVSDTLLSSSDEQDEQSVDGELVVYVNDVPHSIAVRTLEETETGVYEVDIPLEAAILQESDLLKVQFAANGLRDADICVPPNNAKWIYLQDDSYIDVHVSKSEDMTFQSWPAPFIGVDELQDTAILLPTAVDSATIQQLYLLTNQLGKRTSLTELDIWMEDNVTDEQLQARHVIVLGPLQKHESLRGYREELFVSATEGGVLDVSPYGFMNESSKYAAWLQPSVWNNKNTMAVFTAVHPDEKTTFSDRFIENIQTTALRADVMVEGQNGRIFSHNVDSKAPKLKKEVESDLTEEVDMKWLLGGFIGIICISLFLFLFFFRRRRRERR